MDKIYDKETPPKDTIQDWVNMACKVDGCMRARSAQKAILANSTSFKSDLLNRFHLQPISHYTSSNALCRMANQVVDMDIDASHKWNADHQKRMHDGKPPSSLCYLCRCTGHWNADCPSQCRGLPTPWGNTCRKVAGKNWRTHTVNMEDEDNEELTLGNQAGIYWGVAEADSNHNNQQIPQSCCLLECGNPSSRTNQPTLHDGTCNILSNRQQTNGSISGTAGVRRVFEELGDVEQKDLLIELAQDFT